MAKKEEKKFGSELQIKASCQIKGKTYFIIDPEELDKFFQKMSKEIAKK